VWKRCLELGVAPATHTPGMGWGSRRSISNYMYNHIGSFGASMEATCKSLFLGGVTRRFPKLCFGLLEGGVGWACSLYADLLSHWEKAQPRGDPPPRPGADRHEAARWSCSRSTATSASAPISPGSAESFTQLEPSPPTIDEFAACEISSAGGRARPVRAALLLRLRGRRPFGRVGVPRDTNPLGARLRAMFSSDIGHWDVPDMAGILARRGSSVEDGLIGESRLREFVFGIRCGFYTSANPDFFRARAASSGRRSWSPRKA
jgi:hypothetical protein